MSTIFPNAPEPFDDCNFSCCCRRRCRQRHCCCFYCFLHYRCLPSTLMATARMLFQSARTFQSTESKKKNTKIFPDKKSIHIIHIDRKWMARRETENAPSKCGQLKRTRRERSQSFQFNRMGFQRNEFEVAWNIILRPGFCCRRVRIIACAEQKQRWPHDIRPKGVYADRSE